MGYNTEDDKLSNKQSAVIDGQSGSISGPNHKI